VKEEGKKKSLEGYENFENCKKYPGSLKKIV
jgi:hypothetical protein